MLDRELHRLGVSDVNYETLARELNFSKVDDFLAAIGRSDVNIHQVVSVIKKAVDEAQPGQAEMIELPPPRSTTVSSSSTSIQIQGVGNLLTNLAQCCRPVPGDNAIIGYITRGRGVTIHRKDCPNILRFNDHARERLIEVDWDLQGTNDTYPVDVQIEAFDRPGLLRDITAIVANEKINMSAVNVITKKQENKAKLLATLEIANIDQLSRVLALISQLPNVVEVRRRRSS
jgi:GTP pyrophosphokinase